LRKAVEAVCEALGGEFREEARSYACVFMDGRITIRVPKLALRKVVV